MLLFHHRNSETNKSKGFALVLALALLSLVFLLVVSLVNLVGTDLSLVEARKEKILAQAHARMGMKIAIGEIQKHLGPDMRISATADLLDERIESGRNFINQNFSPDQSADQGIDLNENGTIDPLPFGQRYWTGVWKHRGRDRGVDQNKLGAKPLPENIDTGDSLSEYPMASSEFDPHPAIEVAWLVSGNEGFSRKLYFGNSPNQLNEFVEVPDGNLWDPDQPDNGRSFIKGGVYGNDENAWEDYKISLKNSPLVGSGGLPEYNHPLFDLPDPDDSEDTEWLLVSPVLKQDFSYDFRDGDAWKQNLGAEPVKVRKTQIKSEISTSNDSRHGAYAYWVGDEGVKTKANIQNSSRLSVDPQVVQDRLLVASEPNLSFQHEESNSLASGFGFEFAGNLIARKKDLLTTSLLPVLSDDNDDVSQYFHSLTTDSFGVLSDVRTGGLKRDLSNAFMNVSDWGSLDDVSDAWADDFSNYIYKDRIFYQKSVPLELNAKENDWRLGSDQVLLEENAILAGPRWSVLGSFHNSYLLSSYDNLFPNRFPRVVGDNSVLYNHLLPYGAKPNSPGTHPSITSSSRLRQNFNYFRGLDKRPEPTNHPIQPVLVEVKYSHHPIYEQNQVGLSMYPSLALWNPYNKAIELENLYVEIPMNVGIHYMNAKHFDLYRKWWMYCFDRELFETANPGVDPNKPTYVIPPGFLNFEDRNGNGKKDPGEPWMGTGNHSGKYPGQPLNRDRFFRQYNFAQGHPYPRSTLRLPLNYQALVGTALGNKVHRRILSSDNQETTPGSGNRHLLLRLNSFSLEPGEKAHFTVSDSGNPTVTHTPLPAVGQTSFLTVNLSKITSGNEDTGFKVLSGDTSLGPDQPLTIRYWCWDIRGVHPNSKESFNVDGERTQNSSLLPPKGITMYYEDPSLVSTENRKIMFKLNKQFNINLGSNLSDYGRCDDLLSSSSGLNLPGLGFRIRYKLPANTENVIFEQFNLRSLVNSNQDGFGNNWSVEQFNSNNAYGSDPHQFLRQGMNGTFSIGTESFNLAQKYPNFFSLPPLDDDNVLGFVNFTPQTITPGGINPSFGVVPKVMVSNQSIGFFHQDDSIGPMESEDRAILFEIFDAPLLSLMQFRHANLNNYSHGPSYAFGNSYASPQVARYQTWGKMKAFSMQPEFPGMDIPRNIGIAQKLQNAGLPYNPFMWLPHREISYDDPVREKYVNTDHQNVTLDHSFYLNNALLDGYFFTGLGKGDDWQENDTSSLEPGDRYLPYRNPRLIPYLRDSEWTPTGYSDKQPDLASSGTDEQYRYQTIAGDLLVDGAFNVNSTSVDAWASQLSSLRGETITGASVDSDKTPVPRFTKYPAEDSWHMLRELSDEEINLLSHKIVEQVKLRGPFLSYADFVNRRIQGNKINLLGFPFSTWNSNKRRESRSSAIGLRGAIQSAIAEAELNQGSFSDNSNDSFLPTLPTRRFAGNGLVNNPWPLASELGFLSSEFGIHAISSESKTFNDHDSQGNVVQISDYLAHPPIARAHIDPLNTTSANPLTFFVYTQRWGRGFYEVKYENPPPPARKIMMPDGTPESFKYHFKNYEDTFSYGEAPENLLAVENVATAANKPGWVMQSDLLSPIEPVSAVRSDTFIVRIMGETKTLEDTQSNSKAWIELTVQRVPDYVKSDLDNPHHRPHEPFEDRNFNGYWDSEIYEHWIDYNQNSITRNRDGTTSPKSDAYPDLAGDNPSFADGLPSDLALNKDPGEEDATNMEVTVSRMGINQRFGRKFKIIKFRWLKRQDV